MKHLKQYSFIFLLFIAALSQLSCKKNNAQVVPSFYYFKTTGSYKDYEAQLSKDFLKHRIYQKILDIGEMLEPLAINDVVCGDVENVEVVPTVFIKNNAFSNPDSVEITKLAQRIVKNLKGKPKELQIDCDWTSSTKDNYFYFLLMVKKANPVLTLSATIRLYPFKYKEKMGIPPVDRGMLMVYNVSKMNDVATPNAILDFEEAEKYIKGGSYPLPLDLALPIFSQGVVFRDNKMIALLKEFDGAMANTQTYLQKSKDNRYAFVADTVVAGHFFRVGDLLRTEDISNETLEKTAKLVSKNIALNGPFHVAFYHLDDATLKKYDAKIMNTVFRQF